MISSEKLNIVKNKEIIKKELKIGLICPTNKYGKSATSSIYYPMGILLVGSLIKDTMPNWEVKIYDGELSNQSYLEQEVKNFDILGLSANTNNYPNCLELALKAKESGVKKAIIGGPHATAIPKKILKNRDYIDATIVYDGEKAFLEYLIKFSESGEDFSGIKNLFWKDNGGEIKENETELPTLPPRLNDMNFSLMDFKPYWQQHKEEFPKMSSRMIEIFTHVGCTWRTESGGCKFCDIPYPVNNYVPPGRFWRDVNEAKNKLKIGSIKDYGDCITGNPERLKALIKARPKNLEDMELSCYARSKEITPEVADMLKELNVKYVYIGFDSGSNPMLRSMRQGYRVDHNYKATDLLSKRGVNITGSLIIGVEGETEETIAETEKFAENISKYKNITQLYCSVLNVFPGAPYGKKMLETHPELENDDTWDVIETQKLWVKEFCKVSHEDIIKKAKDINKFNPSDRQRYFGIPK